MGVQVGPWVGGLSEQGARAPIDWVWDWVGCAPCTLVQVAIGLPPPVGVPVGWVGCTPGMIQIMPVARVAGPQVGVPVGPRVEQRCACGAVMVGVDGRGPPFPGLREVGGC